MKKFFSEFKKIITRGNVVDMAVGVIVGSSFTAIVNGLSNFVLKPIINWILALIFKENSLAELFTFLKRVDKTEAVLDEAGNQIGTVIVPDLAQSIYIDWGSLINAIINFFLIAFVLFTIVKIINKARENNKAFSENMKKLRPTKEERREMKALGVSRFDKELVAAYYAEKEIKAEEAKKAAEAEAAEKARLDRLANPTTEDLLKEILQALKEKA